MDFIDKLAILLSGKQQPKQQPPRTPQKGVRVENKPIVTTQTNLTPLQPTKTIKVVEQDFSNKSEQKIEVVGFQDKTLSAYLEERSTTLGDTIVDNSIHDTFNDIAAKENIADSFSRNRNLSDKNIVNKLLPFLDTKTDMGVWVYRNRYGVILTMSIYIIILATMLFAKIGLSEANLSNGVYIDIPVEEIEEIVEEKKIEKELSEYYENQNVENIAVDKNMELDASLKDDRNIQTSDLYREAMEAQNRLAENRNNYNQGLEDIANIKPKESKKSDKSQEATKKSINKAGNVTVAYDLKGRYVVRPEIPAYRCKGAGKVVVEIEVLQDGKVASASIVSMSGVSDECLPQMALEAAKATIFNIDYDSPKKQIGQVSFVFVAQ